MITKKKTVERTLEKNFKCIGTRVSCEDGERVAGAKGR